MRWRNKSGPPVVRGAGSLREWVRGRVAVLMVVLVAAVGLVGTEPAAATAEMRWLQVDVGDGHTCGIKVDHTLWCWGRNDVGQLGVGDYVNRRAPTEVWPGKRDWSLVATGYWHTCALDSDILWCWGDNSMHQISIELSLGVSRNTPTFATDVHNWVTMSAGGMFTCAIRSNQMLYCWGDNRRGQVGVGRFNTTEGTWRDSPVRVGGHGWVEVEAGGSSVCGRKVDNRRYCWGSDQAGVLGLGDMGDQSRPKTIDDGVYRTVSVGLNHACGISMTRRLYCWGSRAEGKLGLGEFNEAEMGCCLSPPDQRTIGTSWDKVYVGVRHACALDTQGYRYCWGSNRYGQLGLGDLVQRNTPEALQIPMIGQEGTTWESLAVGNVHTCGIRVYNQSLACWGYNSYGQLGNPNIGLTNKVTVPAGVLASP